MGGEEDSVHLLNFVQPVAVAAGGGSLNVELKAGIKKVFVANHSQFVIIPKPFFFRHGKAERHGPVNNIRKLCTVDDIGESGQLCHTDETLNITWKNELSLKYNLEEEVCPSDLSPNLQQHQREEDPPLLPS
jgi:hypothetical protein